MRKSFKTELKPNNKQRTLLVKHCGVARFTYNLGLNRQIENKKNGNKFLTAIDLHKELVKLKNTDYPWLREVSKWVPQEALRNLEKAYKNFFRNCKNKKKGKKGFPRFKSRKNGIGSFTLCEPIYVYDDCVKLPRIGRVRLKEKSYVPTNLRITQATISEKAGKWFVAISFDIPKRVSFKPREGTVGVDLGLKELAVCSDGLVVENPRPLKKRLKKLKRLQKKHSKKQKGSKNKEKSRIKLSKLHYKISCIRRDTLHKLTTYLTKTKSRIVIEDLSPSNMIKNHCLAQAISDVGWAEFRRQLEYKAEWYNCKIVVVDRFYPSSKKCNKCGNIKKDLTLADRIYKCEACGLEIDRDLNAAINLEKYPSTASSAGIKACGENNQYLGSKEPKQVISGKQEANTGSLDSGKFCGTVTKWFLDIS
jgi:putative transposase